MKRPPRTLPVAVIWPFQRGFTQLGISRELWLQTWERHGFPLAKLSDPSTRLSLDRTFAEIRKHAHALGRGDLGLLAAAAIEPGDFGVVELAARASSSALEAFESLAHDFNLFAEGLHLSVEHRAGVVTLRFTSDPDLALPPLIVEYVLLALLQFVRHYRPGVCAPRRVRFAHPRVTHADLLADTFACPADFDAVEHALDFDRADLEAPSRPPTPSPAKSSAPTSTPSAPPPPPAASSTASRPSSPNASPKASPPSKTSPATSASAAAPSAAP